MSQNTLNKVELSAAASLASVYVLRMLGLFMVIPVIAVAALEFEDYSPLLVGLAVGGYGLTQAILQIPFGVLSDKWGRKSVIYLGLSLFCMGSLIAGFADSMLMLTLGRILQGAGAIAGAIMALASDVTRESQRTKVMAVIGVSIGFSFYIALLLGPVLAAYIGLQGIFLLTAVLSLACFPLIKWGVDTRDAQAAPAGDALPKLSQIGGLFKHSMLWRLNVSVLVVHMLITCFFVQIPLYLVQLDMPLSEHYKVYSIVLLLSVGVLAGFIYLSKHLPLGNSFRLALLLMALGFFLLIVQTPSYWLICVAGILFFGGFNFLEAKMPALVSSLAPAGQKGSAMGIYASHQFFGAFLGGISSGLMNSFFDVETTFILCLVMIFMCTLVTRGLSAAEKVRRVTLSIPNREAGALGEQDSVLEQHLEALRMLPGVKDVIADPIDMAFYLKVDAKTFNLKDAKGIIGADA
ncbi:MFS transporter [Glaciecola sp. XM2]|uniref:MFS transporter n=1 Tax=Glaciecola sp. XM2 TaxID=1914931 RepID=UPI001BDEEB46|nr:MFS transporter [Glaciecola sp. XM2]MBT1451706.1 MFS transporter [Glaciecola sp. XM2]